jgi:hypothetical protein
VTWENRLGSGQSSFKSSQYKRLPHSETPQEIIELLKHTHIIGGKT